MNKTLFKKLVLPALFLAIGLILPMIFHSLSISGLIFLPIHIPVLLCGLICGKKEGFLIGLALPFLSSVLTGMPPIFPVAITMTFELAAYGFFIGLFSEKFSVITSLISGMIIGRLVSGLSGMIVLGFAGKTYSLTAFVTASFITAFPGILIQIITIPLLVKLLEKALHQRRKNS